MSDETTVPEDAATDEDAFTFVEDPTFDVDYKGECAYEVKVSVPPANTSKKAEEMIVELKDEAELPGFRRGKVPLNLIKKKFSKHVKSEVRGKLVGEAFEKLIKDEDLKPVGYPDIDGLEDDKEFNDDEALEFTLKFEVSPRVELGKYRGLKVERPVVKVDDDDLDETIADMLKQHAVYETAAVKADEGDQVVMDFNGTVNDEEFSGGSAENYPYVLGSNRFFPEFEDALLGSKADDVLNCIVDFPDDYFSEDLQGKKADFTIKVHEVKRQTTPELTDDFAKEIGYESVADLREKVTANMREASESQSNQIAESRLLERIIENSTYEMSKSIIESVARDNQQRELQHLMQHQLAGDELEARIKEIQENADENAIRSIKTMVTLNEIGEAEGIELSDEDFEKEAMTMAKSMGMESQVEAVAQYMFQGEQRNTHMDRIYRTKAMAVVVDNATITDKELTREEMEAAEKAESGAEDGDA
jgi:trigger factor